MDCTGSFYNVAAVMALMSLLPTLCYSQCNCNYPAIFNFGDSTSDTGNIHNVFPYQQLSENPPYGETFFGQPASRYSDGRLSIDFFAKALGMPFLSPYCQSVMSNFGNGANFAAAGATVLQSTYFQPISLNVQISQFKNFKQQVLASIQSGSPPNLLPSEEAFKTGIYIMEIGGNDFNYGYTQQNLTIAQIKQSVLPRLARGVAGAVQALYDEGARTILVRNIGPQGCQSYWLTTFSPTDLDKNGCSNSYNDAVRFYNRQLQAQLTNLRKKLADATIIYVNAYDIIYDLFANPSNYGFNGTTKACCGVGGKYNFYYAIQCGSTGNLGGQSVKAEACPNPASYVIWDGIHWTDEANRQITKQILSGKYFQPAFDLSSFCDLQPI